LYLVVPLDRFANSLLPVSKSLDKLGASCSSTGGAIGGGGGGGGALGPDEHI